jgi:hypothetical protein
MLDWTPSFRKANLQPMIRSLRDKSEFALPKEQKLDFVPVGNGHVTPVLRGETRVVPGKAAAGAKPRPGRWEVLASVTICGFSAAGRVRERKSAAELQIQIGAEGAVRPRRTGWSAVRGKVARRLPAVARLLRRAKERRGPASA